MSCIGRFFIHALHHRIGRDWFLARPPPPTGPPECHKHIPETCAFPFLQESRIREWHRLCANSLQKNRHGFSEGIFQHLLFQCVASANFGAPCSQDKFARRGYALRFQFSLCLKPIIKVVAGVASPIQIKLISAMLDLFRFRVLFAVGAWLVWMFVMLHVLNG